MESKIKNKLKLLPSFLISILFLSPCDTFAQEKVIITITFFKEGKPVEINNNFHIYIFTEDSLLKKTYLPKIQDNQFTLPQFNKEQKGIILFVYKNHCIAFDQVNLYHNQNMKWEFGIDNRPFHPDNHAGTSKDEIKKIKQINYLKFNPLEYGDGTRLSNYIHNMRQYKNDVKKLLIGQLRK